MFEDIICSVVCDLPWFAYLALSHLGEVKQKDGGSSGSYRVLLRSPGDFRLLAGEAKYQSSDHS